MADVYSQALEIQSEIEADFIEVVNLIRKYGYNRALLILLGQ